MSKKGKKILIVIFLAILTILLFNSNVVNAEINHSYLGSDTVTDDGLDYAFNDSIMLKSLVKLIFAIARWLESLMGYIFSMLTGTSNFPWADKIVFNAVALLDVNFINPADNSFVNTIQDILKDIYSTILTLAIGFFGIVVLITAIKLVISSIAAEKAKYKKALVDWVVGFAMLFCIHYFISFVFYLNEQLVKVAANIVMDNLDNAERVVQGMVTELEDQLIEKAEELNVKYNGEPVADIMRNNRNILTTWVYALDSSEDSHGAQEAFMKGSKATLFSTFDEHKADDKTLEILGMIIKWAASENISVTELADIKGKIRLYCRFIETDRYYPNEVWLGQFINTEEFKKLFINPQGEFDSEMHTDFINAIEDINDAYGGYSEYEEEYNIIYYSYNLYDKVTIGNNIGLRSGGGDILYNEKHRQFFDSKYGDLPDNWAPRYYRSSFYFTDLFDDLITLKSASTTSIGKEEVNSEKKVRIISDLASYFRFTATSKELRSTNITGMKEGKNIKMQSVIMYAVLVGQSLILFMAYIKRLFYVVILAMLAPIVVVVDFFQKFGK